MKPQFDELLPFYVNGTLADTDRAWVEDYLSEHPVARAELQWYESLQTKLREDVPAVSSEVGLDRTMQRIRAERAPAEAVRKPAEAKPRGGLLDWLASLARQAVARPAFAGACALVVLQAGVIGTLMVEQHDDSSELRAMRGTAVVDHGPYLKVNFKGDAREADIRILLVEVRGNLVSGPGQLGDYYVRVPEPQLDATTATLSGSSIVEAVAVVDALPAR